MRGAKLMFAVICLLIFAPDVLANDSTFVFENFHLSMDMPRDWTRDNPSESMFTFKMKCGEAVPFCPNLVARFIPIREGFTLDNCADQFAATFQQRYKSVEWVNVMDKNVDAIKMIVVDYKLTENGAKLGGTTAFIILDDKKTALALSIMAPNDENGGYVNYRRLFERILNSTKPA